MADEKKTQEEMAEIDNVDIEPLSDDELDSVAGGLSAGLRGSSGSCCTCRGSNCSLTEAPCVPEA